MARPPVGFGRTELSLNLLGIVCFGLPHGHGLGIRAFQGFSNKNAISFYPAGGPTQLQGQADGGVGPKSSNWKLQNAKTGVGFGRTELSLRLP